MGFWSKEGFEKPLSFVDGADLPKIKELGDGLAHDWHLPWSIMDLLNGDRRGVASVNDTLIVLDGDEQASVVEDGPVALDEDVDLLAHRGLEMGEVEFCYELLAMLGFVVLVFEGRVDAVDGGRWMAALAQDFAPIDSR